MRLDGAGGETEAARLLSRARDLGVRSFHCSAEYPTFALFAAAWDRAGLAGTEATLVCKIASPHFGEDRFSAATVRAKIDNYCSALGVERVDTVQWLLRHDLNAEEARGRILADAADEIGELVSALKQEGRIGAFVGFPYSRPIADALVAAPWCDGLALYVNALEREMDPVVMACAHAAKPVIAIRPYAAGRVFVEAGLSAQAALEHAFGFPAVATVVVSCSSEAHLTVLLPYLAPER